MDQQPETQIPISPSEPAMQQPIAPAPAPKSKRKLWFIVAGIVLVAGLIAALVLFFSDPHVSKEEYSKAAVDAKEVSKQFDDLAQATQNYVVVAGKRKDVATIKDLNARMNKAYDALLATQNKLAQSPALKDRKVKSYYDAYNKKAQAFKKLIDQYRVSVPLFVSAMDTCDDISNDMSDIFDRLRDFAGYLAGTGSTITKEKALANYDRKTQACIAGAVKLKDAGNDTFDQVGGAYVTLLTGMRQAIAAHYDDADKYGFSVADDNYAAANKKLEEGVIKSLKAIGNQQKKDSDDTDYTHDIDSLASLLSDKSK